MLRVNCGDIIINCRSLNLDKKLYAAIPILVEFICKLGIQIPYLVLRGEMVKVAKKWHKGCRLCQIKNPMPKSH